MFEPAPPTHTIGSPAPGVVRENRRLTPRGSADVRHVVIDLENEGFAYVEGQAVGVLVPGEPGEEGGPRARYYAIASASDGDDGRGRSLSLCVKRSEGPGGGSSFLCDLRPGDRIGLVGPLGPIFPLPDDPIAPLLLVATGTGVAAFRGLLQRIASGHGPWPGPLRLDHGVRTRAEAVYADELTALVGRANGTLVHAISREPIGRHRHVDAAIAAEADALWPLLRSGGGSLYICGVRGMEHGVEEVFARWARRDGLAWEDVRGGWIAEGRLRVSTS